MKYNKFLYVALGMGLMLTSCDEFLDKVPDNRAELNTSDKVTKILVAAYPESNSIVMAEMASDNAMDNGSLYTVEDKMQEESYLWTPITTQGNDSPQTFWDNCYLAVATANQALAAIEDMGNPANLQAQRGEALLCRAWGHFLLANIFCQAYSPETASNELGLPYSEAPETEVKPDYQRGTLAELYEKIEKDIEEGLPLINDEIYTVPKYHFNRKAAYAFAARFYLYYQKWDKVIEAANVVLGNTPQTMMRDWNAIYNMPSNFESRCNAYVAASSPANLLLQTAYSSMVYWLGPYSLSQRYGHNHTNIAKKETYRTAGIWGEYNSGTDLYMGASCWGMEQKLYYSKYYGYFEYTDKVNGIGYRRNVIAMLTAPETLLCRAEAYAVKKDYAKALADINTWLSANSRSGIQVTADDVVNVYGNMNYMEDENGTPIVAGENGTPKKRLNPSGFSIEPGMQENFIHCILHMRRCETMADGLRWQDIKRYGIEIAHNREGLSADILRKDDLRRAFQLPADVIDAGLQANPRND